jgi:hypothetical protein
MKYSKALLETAMSNTLRNHELIKEGGTPLVTRLEMAALACFVGDSYVGDKANYIASVDVIRVAMKEVRTTGQLTFGETEVFWG